MLSRLLERRRQVAAALGILAGLLALSSAGYQGVDRLLRSARDQLRSHAASGQVAIVEIDSRSLRELVNWPFPRRYHGALVDRLRRSGVRTIGFDVDFSSQSNPVDDAAFAASLSRAGGGVMLAVLRQEAASGSDEMVENLPIPELRDQAFLAAVNVIPDEDGQVRQMPLGLEIAGSPRPSLAALTAERDGAADGAYTIDFSIDPATIPRYSYVDIIMGRVPAEALRGKRVIVGATAVESGDRYAVPDHGVIPGVVIQAVAAETLLAGPPPTTGSPIWPLLLAFGTLLATLRKGPRARRAAFFVLGSAAVLGLPLAGEAYWALSFSLWPALAALAVGLLSAALLQTLFVLRERKLVDRESGLPNAAALVEAASPREPVVVVARVEGFAAIAAGLGAESAAALIVRVAERLGFGHDSVVHRVDEAHLAWVESGDEAATLQERLDGLVEVMRAPVDCGRPVDVMLTFGIAGQGGAGIRQQLADATSAAERSFARGLHWERFAAGEETDLHLSLCAELNKALEKGEVWNAYQPKLDLRTGAVCGVEALVRWDHPTRGPISPDQFVPFIELRGQARDLTIHVLRGALHDVSHWRTQGISLGVAVNISTTLLGDPLFAILLEQEIASSRCPPGSITLEVTETAAMKNREAAVAALASWRRLGVQVSIDDYGTGQSSLAYLQALPATELKIDKSFVTDLTSNPRNEIMVRSTIALAHELEMKVVAEGIEDAKCLARLTKLGCDVGQGWHIGKPIPADGITALLTKDRRAAA